MKIFVFIRKLERVLHQLKDSAPERSEERNSLNSLYSYFADIAGLYEIASKGKVVQINIPDFGLVDVNQSCFLREVKPSKITAGPKLSDFLISVANFLDKGVKTQSINPSERKMYETKAKEIRALAILPYSVRQSCNIQFSD